MVVGHHLDGGIEAAHAVVSPVHLHPAFFLAVQGVDALCLVDGHAPPPRNVAHDLVAGHGAAALGEAHGNVHILVAHQNDAVVGAAGIHPLLGLFGQLLQLRRGRRLVGALLVNKLGHHIHRRHAAVAHRAEHVIHFNKAILLQHALAVFGLEQVAQINAPALAFPVHHGAAQLDVLALEFLFQELADFRLGLWGFADAQPVGGRALAGGGGHDLHPVACFQRGIQRHNLAVHLGAHALVAHGGMDAVGKVQGRGALGHGDHVALGGKEENLLGKQIGLEGIDKLLAVAGFILPVQNLTHPEQLAVQVIAPAAALLVAPVGGNAVLSHTVHLPGADLHLEGEGHLPSAHHRGVQGLVHVGLGHGDIVLEAAGNLVPQGMHNAQHRVAVGDGVHQYPDGNQVVNLVEGLVLQNHLAVDGVEVLGPAVDIIVDVLFVQLGGQLRNHHADILLALGAFLSHLLHQVLIPCRVDVAQGKILQLLLDGIHAQPVGQGCVNIEGFPGDGHLPGLRLVLEGAHVVQPVSQLDEHHADVLAHGQDHLAQGFSLGFLLVGKVQLVQLGHAVHQVGHLIAELLLDGFQGDAFAVLHRVVEQPRRNGGRVNHQLGEDACHKAGVGKVGLAALALLPGVGLLGKAVGLLHQLVAVAGGILLHPCQHLIQRHGFINRVAHSSILPSIFIVLSAGRADSGSAGCRSWNTSPGAAAAPRRAPATPPPASPA